MHKKIEFYSRKIEDSFFIHQTITITAGTRRALAKKACIFTNTSLATITTTSTLIRDESSCTIVL